LLSELPSDLLGGTIEVNDKVAHLGLYLVLGGTLAWAGWKGRGRAVSPWILLLLGVAYGALDEVHQRFVPGRDSSLGDLLADSAGVLLGFLAVRAILRAWAKGASVTSNHTSSREA
jgi:VanZ family protein